jgi:nucleoside phosphorylase
MVAGLAGALDRKLKRGDAVVFDLCYDGRINKEALNSREKQSAREENASINCHIKMSKLICETLQRSGLSSFSGAGVTVDQIITRAEEKISLGVRYQATAVDMETYDILTVCQMFGLPATALRVISDEADTDLPDFNRALDPQGQLSNWRTASVMMSTPIVSARFLLNMKPVVKALRAHLKAVLST